jgi:hypothetical protein
MTDRLEKRHRKEALDRWKAQQRATARGKLLLPDAQLQALFDWLDAELPQRKCDHTLRLSREWLAEQNIEVAPVEAWLRENGGYCDCEALANAAQAWREAIHDVNW